MAEYEVNDVASFRSAFAVGNLHDDDIVRITRSITLPDDINHNVIKAKNIRIIGGAQFPTSDVEARPALVSNVKDWLGADDLSLFVVHKADGTGEPASVTFENLELFGNYEGREPTSSAKRRGAVLFKKGGSGEVRNCTVRGWPRCGVRVETQSAVTVTNCDIRNCRQDGLGYGIDVQGGSADVSYCVFHACRHAIAAGSREPSSSSPGVLTSNYTIHDCHITTIDSEHGHVHHGIDVHGSSNDGHGADSPDLQQSLINFGGTRHQSLDYDPSRCGGFAGVRFTIYRNTIVNAAGDLDPDRLQPGVMVRGQPMDYCAIHDNLLIGCGIHIPKYADNRRFYIEGNRRADG